jgi:hypothetical protein
VQGPSGLRFDALLDGRIAGEPRDLLRRRICMLGPSQGFGAGPHDATPNLTGEAASATAPRLLDEQVLEPVEVAVVHGVEATADGQAGRSTARVDLFKRQRLRWISAGPRSFS